jgi:serine/threonine protein kinase/Tol biopolymer transport system component
VTTPLNRLTDALADRYQIERELGQGGMATVYLAKDIKHHRPVAIKVLHPELSAMLGSERFLKEIELTANLQHPHVLPLFDSGDAGGLLYYVMPLVDGETLRGRLEREQQLPVAEAVRIAIDVADALQYAHKHGVVHRDIKPENILLHDGRPQVADFGIALAVQQAAGTRMTQTGMSLGTPQYMAPEQAMGDPHVDHRTDIYALGVVAYEMLAGEPPFIGPSSQAIVARVMTEKPRSLRSLRDTVPHHVAEAVHTALQKLPADRFESAAELARALQDPGFHATASIPAVERTDYRTRKLIPVVLVLGIIAIGLGALAAWGWLRPPPESVPRVAWQFPVSIPDSAPLTSAFSLSDDGATLVYGGGRPGSQRIWLRRADATTPTPIEGTEDGVSPALSPDGRRVSFLRSGRLYLVPVEGGKATMVADSIILNTQAVWLDDNHLVFANQGGLERVDVRGGEREPVTHLDSVAGDGLHTRPSILPGGGVVFSLWPANDASPTASRIAVTNTGGGHSILMPGVIARYAHPGHLLVLHADGVLLAVPFDVTARRVTGSARTVATGLVVAAYGIPGVAVSPSGRIAFVTGNPLSVSDLMRVQRNGQATPVDTDWAQAFGSVAISPDGRRVAVSLRTLTSEEIQVRDLVTGGIIRITLPGIQLRGPSFSPDGASIVFSGLATTLMGVYRVAPGSSSPPELLLQLADLPSGPALSPDGRTLYYHTSRGSASDLFAQPLDSLGTPPHPMLATPAKERSPVPSPDGRWLAYNSDESGRDEVFIRSADPRRTERWQVSRSGGRPSPPRWSRDGRELFYVSRDSLVAARVAPGEEFAIVGQTTLFSMAPYLGFDVMPGGGFMMVRPRQTDPGAQQLMMLEQWNAGSSQ